jgi:1,2-diacylglycerol 3-beta-galactosyltransferase
MTAPHPARIDLLYIESGGGHRAAATALREVIARQGRDWDVRLRSVQEIFDPIDVIRKTMGVEFQELYNIMLRRGWTLGSAQLIPLMHLLIRSLHNAQVRLLGRFWSEHPADLVVSLVPHYNRAFRQALALACPAAPFMTVMTDLFDYPPHFWIERIDQHLVCGAGRAVEQAIGIGMPRSRILRASGMILHPRFYDAPPLDRAAERKRLGLRPDLATGLVLFGGEGSNEIPRIARALNRAGSGVQLILLCGRSAEIAAGLRAMPKRIPMFVEGFTRDVPHYMALSDFFIGKPGPGSISEALAMKLPVIVASNAWTLAHERANADWVREEELGMVAPSFAGIGGTVAELLQPERYRRVRARVSATRNRAVFEIPEMMETVLSRSGAAAFVA